MAIEPPAPTDEQQPPGPRRHAERAQPAAHDQGAVRGGQGHNAGAPRSVDERHMARAIEQAWTVHRATSPNPWVGAVLVTVGGRVFDGATEPPGGAHAEVVALARARHSGAPIAGATLYVTLEPCAHHGRTPPCADAIVAAGVTRVVVGIEDPDEHVAGGGVARLRGGGVTVDTGVAAEQIGAQLAPYLKQRRTGRPWVTLKLASTLDGRTAAADGSSRWITGPEARTDAHRLRAEHDAVLVGAGTIRRDDPALTVRHAGGRDPLRVVLGAVPPGARASPALELGGPLGDVLDDLGRRGVLSLLVEGGATVAHGFLSEGLADRYVVYLAPAFMGGSDGHPLFDGAGAPTIDAAVRGRITSITELGGDLRLDVVTTPHAGMPGDVG